ncbi:hypothetical protein HPB50_002098 [Hyalomma asiaticum]|uniref:Uncharacterized protein n=1 Tax=Hyalomma asiaticum TaxID=266040 RepID=A0ACB7RH74_HYAAI|nr:hypothetical protein HPB50_002098 [Hyalomma asiaticum]
MQLADWNNTPSLDSAMANRSPLETASTRSNDGSDQKENSATGGECVSQCAREQREERCHAVTGDCCDAVGADECKRHPPNERSEKLVHIGEEQIADWNHKDTEVEDVNHALPEGVDLEQHDGCFFRDNQVDAAELMSPVAEEALTPTPDINLTLLAIPVIYRPLERSPNFWQVDHEKVRRDLVKCAECKLPPQRVLKSGFLSVIAPNPEAARNLLRLTVIADIAVDPRLPSWYIRNVGKISGVPFRYSDRQLLDCFTGAGVIHVRRQITYLKDTDGSLSTTPEDCIILTFRPDIELPETIALGFDVFRVQAYCAAPLQCYHCLRFGHIAYQCNSPRRCKICAGPHIYKECKSQADPFCANCGGAHAATFSGCPERRRVAMERRFMSRYYVEWEELSSRRPSVSSKRRDRPKRYSKRDYKEGKSSRNKKEGRRSERRSPSGSREDAQESTESSGGVKDRSKDIRGSSTEGSPVKESIATDQVYVLPRGFGDEQEDYASDLEDTTDDDDTAATPAHRNTSPPKERHEPLSIIKFPRMSRYSKRRMKHGYHRFVSKMMKLGLPAFQRPSDD